MTKIPLPDVVAVDFDGTCVTHAYPHMGSEIGAPPVLRALVEAGSKLILYTMRTGKELDAAVQWFARHNIPLWGVNKNPDQHKWTESPKIYANKYIDDAALGVPLLEPSGADRPHVDWVAVAHLLGVGEQLYGPAPEGWRYYGPGPLPVQLDYPSMDLTMRRSTTTWKTHAYQTASVGFFGQSRNLIYAVRRGSGLEARIWPAEEPAELPEVISPT